MARRAASKPRGRRGVRPSRSATLNRLGFRKRRGQKSSGKNRRGKSARRSSLGDRLQRLNPRRWRLAIPSRQMIPALVAAVIVALGMAALRIDLIRARYETGKGNTEEQQLNHEIARLTARMRELRDPVELGELAEGLGFIAPELLIDLPASNETDPSDPRRSAIRFANRPAHETGRP